MCKFESTIAFSRFLLDVACRRKISSNKDEGQGRNMDSKTAPTHRSHSSPALVLAALVMMPAFVIALVTTVLAMYCHALHELLIQIAADSPSVVPTESTDELHVKLPQAAGEAILATVDEKPLLPSVRVAAVALLNMAANKAQHGARGIVAFWRELAARGESVDVIAVTEVLRSAIESFQQAVGEESNGRLAVCYGASNEDGRLPTMDSDSKHHQGRGANAVVYDTSRVELVSAEWVLLPGLGLSEANHLRFPLCVMRVLSDGERFQVMAVHCTPKELHPKIVRAVADAVATATLCSDRGPCVALGDINFQYFEGVEADEHAATGGRGIHSTSTNTFPKKGRPDAIGCIAGDSTSISFGACKWVLHSVQPSDHPLAFVGRLQIGKRTSLGSIPEAAACEHVTVHEPEDKAVTAVPCSVVDDHSAAAGALGTETHNQAKALQALSQLHYATLQALCRSGGATATTISKGLDFSSLGLSPETWAGCLERGEGCRKKMIANINRAALH